MNLDSFKNWAVNAGSVGKATDGQYVGECVSLINQYLYKVYGISAGAWGDARAWANDNHPIRNYFDRVLSPQAGDIGVSPGPTMFGHIWIYLSPNLILEQNGRVSRRVSVGAPYLAPSAILRRKGSQGGGMTIEQVVQIAETRRVQLDQAWAEIASLRRDIEKVVAIAEQRLTEAGQKDAQIAADQKIIDDLKAQVASAPKPSEDTALLNSFGEVIVKLLARFGLKK